jgi:hypothetical protein
LSIEISKKSLGRATLPLLVVLSAAELALADATAAVALSLMLCFLSLITDRVAVARMVKAVAVFSTSFFVLSSVSQLLLLGQSYVMSNAVTSAKMFSLALGSVAIAGNIYRYLLRRAYSSWQILSLLLAMRSLTEGFLTLSETLEALKVNYGYSTRRNPLTVVRLATDTVPILLLEIVLRRFEAALTLLPTIDNRAVSAGTLST